MKCSFCGHHETKVIDSRLVSAGTQIRRRRVCSECGERVTTLESLVFNLPRVVKNSGERVAFSEEKLRKGLELALEKRPISTESVDAMVGSILKSLCKLGEREVSSSLIGEMVMEHLKAADPVAYVRFASVYRCFTDISDFKETIDHFTPTLVGEELSLLSRNYTMTES